MTSRDLLDEYRTLFIGMDNLFYNIRPTSNFPFYNIFQIGKNEFKIELALAGFSKEDIEITLENSVLSISHEDDLKDWPYSNDVRVIHRGITKKSFKQHFPLAENIKVKDASFVDGLLTINLERIIPEEKKPKTINIK